MLGKKNQSALLAKYFSMYKKNPRSKVFAPLAESFRRLGMLDDAYKILKEGIRYHPTYTLGHIVLANCYFDQGKFELTYNTLRPIVSQNADNISLQKVFALACLNLGHLEEALDTYKYLLFMNPRDKYFGQQVKKLEDELMVGHKKLSLEQLIRAPEAENIIRYHGLDDDWIQVDFNKNQSQVETKSPQLIEEKNENQWVMEKPGMMPVKEVASEVETEKIKKSSPNQFAILKEETIQERSLEDDFYADEFEELGDLEEADLENSHSDSPIVSHTLIDLYIAQGYNEKAVELLEKILELNPHDQSSQQKLEQVLMINKGAGLGRMSTEEDEHEELISIIEGQVKLKSPRDKKLQETLGGFLDALKERAQTYR